MRIILILVLSTLSNIRIESQVRIRMSLEDGVYVMPCSVNGLNLRFIFDTGASDVSISLTEALFMLKNGYLENTDLSGTERFRIANGEIAEGTMVNLRNIKIGELVLTNVKASIVHNLDAPLLLGQSALSRFGMIQFDYTNSTLTVFRSYNSDLSSSNTTSPTSVAKNVQTQPGTYIAIMATNVYSNKEGAGKSIVHIEKNSPVEVLNTNTGNPEYWFVSFKGIRGYLLATALQ